MASYYRRAVGVVKYHQPPALSPMRCVEELPRSVRSGRCAFPYWPGHRLRRPKLLQYLQHPADQRRMVSRCNPPHLPASSPRRLGDRQRDRGLADPAHTDKQPDPPRPARAATAQLGTQFGQQHISSPDLSRKPTRGHSDRQPARRDRRLAPRHRT
jgi:hypothetical protein